MVFSFKWLFRNKEKEVKKADLAKTKQTPKSITRAQVIVRDNFNHILPETKRSPDIESNAVETPKQKVIEFPSELLQEYGLPEHNEHDILPEFDVLDVRTNKRKNIRASVTEILNDDQWPIHVNTVNLKTRILSVDILSDISGSGLQITSEIPKEKWDTLSFDFHINRDEFSLVWIVRNVLSNNRYWVEFINPPKDQVRIIELTIWSVKAWR